MAFRGQHDDDSKWWMQWAWRFAFWQGLHRDEIVAIRCSSINLTERQVVVRDEKFVPKGKREDVIPLLEPSAQIAIESNADSRSPGERLFRHTQTDKISRTFRQARNHATGQIPDDEIRELEESGLNL